MARVYQARLNATPAVEAEMSDMMRDFGNMRREYQDLLAKKQTSALATSLEKQQQGAQFRIIDPPRVSPDPVPPTRAMLLAIAFAISLFAGLAASFVANEVLPTFRDVRALRDVAARPILGTVSMLPSERITRLARRRAYLFVGGLGGLLASFAAVLAFALLIGRAA